jgi:hemolysin activation/secretion protein
MKKNQIFIMLSLLGTSIYAAEPPTSAAIQPDATQRQQQRDDALQKQIQPEPSVQTGLEKQLQHKPQLQFLKSYSEEVCFEIKKFVMIGEDARQFTFAMRPVTQGQYNLIGRCIGVQGLNQALDLIQNDLSFF